jgi:hypothetical protein
MLLVFDKREHLIEVCAEVAERPLVGCPRVRLLCDQPRARADRSSDKGCAVGAESGSGHECILASRRWRG